MQKYTVHSNNIILTAWKNGHFVASVLCTIERRTDSRRILGTLKNVIFEFDKSESFAASIMKTHSSDDNFRPFWIFCICLKVKKFIHTSSLITKILNFSNFVDLRTLAYTLKNYLVWTIILDFFSLMILKQNTARPGHYFLLCCGLDLILNFNAIENDVPRGCKFETTQSLSKICPFLLEKSRSPNSLIILTYIFANKNFFYCIATNGLTWSFECRLW